jgi:hypothetical protein
MWAVAPKEKKKKRDALVYSLYEYSCLVADIYRETVIERRNWPIYLNYTTGRPQSDIAVSGRDKTSFTNELYFNKLFLFLQAMRLDNMTSYINWNVSLNQWILIFIYYKLIKTIKPTNLQVDKHVQPQE